MPQWSKGLVVASRCKTGLRGDLQFGLRYGVNLHFWKVYCTHQGSAGFKIATGNMLTFSPSVGFYTENLFQQSDRVALTIDIDIGVSAWTNGLLFKDITLGFKYAF
jgi:hypothetical protein